MIFDNSEALKLGYILAMLFMIRRTSSGTFFNNQSYNFFRFQYPQFLFSHLILSRLSNTIVRAITKKIVNFLFTRKVFKNIFDDVLNQNFLFVKGLVRIDVRSL